MTTNLDWMTDGLCRQVGWADLWFPEKGGNITAASRVCAACPVQTDCLEYAVARPDIEGVWAGTTQTTRMHMRTARRQAVAA